MSDVPFEVIGFLIFFICLFLLYLFLQWKIANETRNQYFILTHNIIYNPRLLATQQEDIYNISGRVPQQQQQQQGQGQWPPHSTTGQVTLDNLTISNETNKHNDDPPTYEEAMRLAIAASQDPSNNVVPAVVPPSAVPMAPPKPSD